MSTSHYPRKQSWIVCLSAALSLALPNAVYSTEAADSAPVPPVLRNPARGVFLVANRRLQDVNFSRSVVLLTDHSDVGTVGLIINKKSTVPITSVVPKLQEFESRDANLHFGGPVSLQSVRILVRSLVEIAPSQRIIQDVYFINSIEVLHKLLEQDTSLGKSMKFFAGYAAWRPGQLEGELARGDWHLVKASPAIIFSKDVDTVWKELVEPLEGTWVLLDNASSSGSN